MLTVRKQTLDIYVDRTTQQWIVRDSEGIFWAIPEGENAWDERLRFAMTEETDLEPIPGHYRYLLRLPD